MWRRVFVWSPGIHNSVLTTSASLFLSLNWFSYENFSKDVCDLVQTATGHVSQSAYVHRAEISAELRWLPSSQNNARWAGLTSEVPFGFSVNHSYLQSHWSKKKKKEWKSCARCVGGILFRVLMRHSWTFIAKPPTFTLLLAAHKQLIKTKNAKLKGRLFQLISCYK